jgi:hypothetical protein
VTFLNGDSTDSGITLRRHIKAQLIRNIGKESNNWEEQFYLGENPDYQDEYGAGSDAIATMVKTVVAACHEFGAPAMAERAGVSEKWIRDIVKERKKASSKTLMKLNSAANFLASQKLEKAKIINWVRIERDQVGNSQMAQWLGTSTSHLSHMLLAEGEKNWRPIPADVFDRMHDMWLKALDNERH